MHTLNVMHALFAFIQFIHSFHSSFHYFHFHIANKSVHAHAVLYELRFLEQREEEREKNRKFASKFDVMNIFVFESGPHIISVSLFSILSAWLIVNGFASLWITNSLKTKQKADNCFCDNTRKHYGDCKWMEMQFPSSRNLIFSLQKKLVVFAYELCTSKIVGNGNIEAISSGRKDPEMIFREKKTKMWSIKNLKTHMVFSSPFANWPPLSVSVPCMQYHVK